MKSQVPEENPFLLDPEPSTGASAMGPLALKSGGWEVRNYAALWQKLRTERCLHKCKNVKGEQAGVGEEAHAPFLIH